MIALKSNVS